MLEPQALGPGQVRIGVRAFGGLGIAIFLSIAYTYTNHPLFPLQTDSLDWSLAWLLASVFDYYGSTICLCAIIVSTEERSQAIVWCLLCLLLGSPFCCVYIALRLRAKKTIALSPGVGRADGMYE
jgi:heme/copper-type cytochrome/quinol oxidase subunit 3